MDNPVQILGADGKPIVARPSRASMLVGGGTTAYDAADRSSQHMAEWNPYLWSPDGELNMARDTIVSRVRDLVRNDGWASGGVTRILDNAIGANFRPISKPDYRALAAATGNAGFDADWAKEFARAVEASWRIYANDTSRYCDAQRSLTVSQIMRLGFRHKLIDGDALALMRWMPERVEPGRARYATAIQLLDPDRLSNPQLTYDQHRLRGGVEIDDDGAAIAYHIRRAHQGDWWSGADSVHWDRYPRETPWGRPIIVHDFDSDRAGQHRGGAGVLTPVLQRLKMLVKYDSTELDASIINAIFGAYIESPFDPQFVEQALGDGEELGAYQAARVDFHNDRRLSLGGARIPIMFPGEKINAVSASRPNGNFAAFESAVLRNAAAGLGISAQQLSNDWSDVNYSSARAALLEAWKTLTRRRDDFASGFAQPIFETWLEEAFEVENFPMPDGVVPDFIELRTAFARVKWIGPARGWVDPVAEKQGAVLGLDAGLSTLENECLEQAEDWEEVAQQRKREIDYFQELGLQPPTWAGINQQPANQTTKKPEAV